MEKLMSDFQELLQVPVQASFPMTRKSDLYFSLLTYF